MAKYLTVADLIAQLRSMPQDAPVVRLEAGRLHPVMTLGHSIPVERGHYAKHELAEAFTGEWRTAGKVFRASENLERVETGHAFLVKP